MLVSLAKLTSAQNWRKLSVTQRSLTPSGTSSTQIIFYKCVTKKYFTNGLRTNIFRAVGSGGGGGGLGVAGGAGGDGGMRELGGAGGLGSLNNFSDFMTSIIYL